MKRDEAGPSDRAKKKLNTDEQCIKVTLPDGTHSAATKLSH